MGWWSKKWSFIVVPAHGNAIVAIFSVLLFSSTVVYTVFAGLQWYLTRQAIHIEQRAWVTGQYGAMQFELGKPVGMQTGVNNSGKTPAKNVHGAYRIEVVNSAEEPTFDYASPKVNFIDVSILYPNSPQSPGAIMLMQEIAGTHTLEAMNLNQALLDRYNSREVMLIFYSRITYDDVFGIHRWATFCGYRYNFSGLVFVNPPIAMKKCSEYNDVDSN